MQEFFFIPLAYLAGSISSAIIVCKIMGLPDPRTQGSNNPGSTNVLRIGGSKAAFFTLVGDMLKGFLPVFIALQMEVSVTVLAATAMAAFLGHLYPIFFGFKGGKGVATGLGVQFGISWMIGGVIAGLWLFIAKGLRISSLAALVSMGVAPLVVWYFWPEPELIIMQTVMTIMLFWRHRTNIQQLIDGTESKISKDETRQKLDSADASEKSA